MQNDKEVEVSGDKERLTDLFINLVDNAIKYNRKNGRVVISNRAEGNFAVVTVSDTGIGINEDDLGKIFDRFYRVDESRGEVKGAGLGLSIAKAIVDAHDGKIEVKSAAGKGAEFKVTLSLANPKKQNPL